VIADQQWQTVLQEERQNERLLRLSNEILDLIKEIEAAGREPFGGPEERQSQRGDQRLCRIVEPPSRLEPEAGSSVSRRRVP
jgi:hypothetical protein